jgi:hypothetical protein
MEANPMTGDSDARRKKYLEMLSLLQKYGRPLRQILAEARHKVSTEIKDPRPPSYRTMYRWFKDENTEYKSKALSGIMENVSENRSIRKETLRLNEVVIDPLKQQLIRRPKLTLYIDNNTNEILRYRIN